VREISTHFVSYKVNSALLTSSVGELHAMKITPLLFALSWLIANNANAADGGPATITEIPTPSPQSLPQGLDVAKDGSVFYTETAAGKIARLQGSYTREYPLPKSASPNIVKVAEDGVWFTDAGNSAVGLLNPESGAVVEYPVPSGAPPNFLHITSDGAKWFTEPSGVGRLSPSGVITEWHITLEKTDSHIEQISVDPSGFVWFTELNYDGVGVNGTNFVRRLDPGTNIVRAYPVPTFGGTPAGVAAAPTGHIWVSEYFAGKLALLDPQAASYTSTTVIPNSAIANRSNYGRTTRPSAPVVKTITAVAASVHYVAPAKSTGWLEYPIPTPGANAEDMRISKDGNLFFEEDGGFLGELDPRTGMVAEYPIPSPNSGYYNIALGDGALWFSEAGAFGPVPTKVGLLQK
jgi:virginiamycin B lyase